MAQDRASAGGFAYPLVRTLRRYRDGQLLPLLLGIAVLYSQVPASAQSINDALAHFYTNSPTLKATQLGISSQNEQGNQVFGGAMPQIDLGVSPSVSRTYGYPCASNSGACPAFVNSGAVGVSLSVTQQVDLSGTIDAQIDSAYLGLKSGWTAYRAQEQALLLEAINAYVGVITSQAVESLNRASVSVFLRRRDEAQRRFDAGLGTGTEVANFEAAFQGEQARLRLAVGNSEVAEAEFRRIFGRDPSGLAFPATIANMPRTLDHAIDRAMRGDPALSQAEQALSAAELNIVAAKASNGPSMALSARADHSQDLLRNSGDYNTSFSIGGEISVPLYQGGAGVSRVRQAEIDRDTAQAQLIAQRESTRANVISAWNNLQAQEASLDSFVSQITAAELAVRSAAAELEAGVGTALAVLTAEKDLTSAQVNLSSTRSAQVVASYVLLQAMGDLAAEKMQLPVDGPYFRPDDDFETRKVDNIASDLFLDHERATATPSFLRWLYNDQ